MDLALNNPQRVMCDQTKQTKPNQISVFSQSAKIIAIEKVF